MVALGCEVDIPGGHLLLGLTDIERVYLSQITALRLAPSRATVGAILSHADWTPPQLS